MNNADVKEILSALEDLRKDIKGNTKLIKNNTKLINENREAVLVVARGLQENISLTRENSEKIDALASMTHNRFNDVDDRLDRIENRQDFQDERIKRNKNNIQFVLSSLGL